MKPATELTLGYIHYLNCIPFFFHLKKNGFQGDFVTGVPSELNRMLQDGQLDASPSSSFEYARNWRDYLLLPGHSIASSGKVGSVLFFSSIPPEKLAGQQIYITGESATSINLLRIIFREFYAVHDVADVVPDQDIEALIVRRKPALLIGDRALKMAGCCPPGIDIYDLGEIWYQHTGLPFVFALWMIRRGVPQACPEHLARLGDQLLRSREQVLHEPRPVADAIADTVGLDPEKIVDYWRTIDLRLEDEHVRGLQLFFQLCKKYDLLSEEPELNFYQS